MKKYGIRITEKDETPGFRSKDITEKWFESEGERDSYYEIHTRERKYDIRDTMLENDYITISYLKIESDALI